MKERHSQGKIVSTLKIYEAVKSIRYDIGHHVLLTRVADVGRMPNGDDGVFEILWTWSLQTERTFCSFFTFLHSSRNYWWWCCCLRPQNLHFSMLSNMRVCVCMMCMLCVACLYYVLLWEDRECQYLTGKIWQTKNSKQKSSPKNTFISAPATITCQSNSLWILCHSLKTKLMDSKSFPLSSTRKKCHFFR